MKTSNNVKIKLESIHIKTFNSFLIYNNIYYSNFLVDGENVILTVDYKHYKEIKKRYKKNVSVIKYYGSRGVREFILTHRYILISLVWGYILLTMLSKTIFEVKINTNNKELYKIIENSLVDNGIEKYKFKKNFKKLSEVKKDILNSNRETLEWIEIIEKGTTYTVEVTPRVIRNISEEKSTFEHIVAKKDGLIMYLTASNGQLKKDVNDYVKKGDIIISGDIIKGEDKIVNQVKAEGKVYGEVWYTVSTTVPYNFIEYSPTDEVINHYYLDVMGHKMTLFGKYNSENVMSEKKIIVDKPYLFFKLIKEKKTVYEYKEFTFTKDEALKEAIERSEKKIKHTLKEDEYIIDKKVLKINEFSSKINIEVFFKVYENLASTRKIAENSKEE